MYCAFLIVVLFEIVVCINSSIIIAVKCADGLIIGTDTLNTGNVLISTRQVKRVFTLSDKVVVCCVNPSSDFIQLYNEIKDTYKDHLIKSGNELTASQIAHYARRLVYLKYQDAHIVVAGVEPPSEQCQSHDYKIYEILPSGTKIEQNILVAGSASSVVTSLAEELWNTRSRISAKVPTDMATDSDFLQKRSKLPSMSSSLKKIKMVLGQASKLDPRSGGKHDIWIMNNDS